MPALAAGLAGVHRGDRDKPVRLVAELPDQPTPGGRADATTQGRASPFDHVGDVQRLDADGPGRVRKPPAGFVLPRGPRVADPAVGSCQLAPRRLVAVAARNMPLVQPALIAPHARLKLRKVGHPDDLSLARGDLSHVHVDANLLPVVRGRHHLVGHVVEQDRVPLSAVRLHDHLLHGIAFVWIAAAPGNFHPADPGQIELVAAHLEAQWRKRHAGVPVAAAGPELRKALAGEGPLPGIVLILQDVPDRVAGQLLEPGRVPAKLRELPVHGAKADERLFPAPLLERLHSLLVQIEEVVPRPAAGPHALGDLAGLRLRARKQPPPGGPVGHLHMHPRFAAPAACAGAAARDSATRGQPLPHQKANAK